jgi:hypothetical protein
MKPSSLLLRCSFGVASSLLASGAWAQSEGPAVLATAQAMYNQAVKAMDRGEHAVACPQLEEVVRLVPEGLGAKLSLGECYQGWGRLASAWTMYHLVDSGAVKPDQMRHRDAARRHLAEIEPRLSYLTVVVSGAVRSLPGLQISRGGTSVGPAQWGVSVPVDRGQHQVVVTAAGKRRREIAIDVDKDGARLSVEIQDLEDAPLPPPVVTPAPAPAPVPPPPQRRWVVPAGVSFGVGALGIGLGAVTGGMAIADVNAIKSRCVDGHCLTSDRGTADTAHTLGVVSTVGFVVGGAAVAAGTVLVIVRPPGKGPRDGVALSAGLGLGQIVVEGRFQ